MLKWFEGCWRGLKKIINLRTQFFRHYIHQMWNIFLIRGLLIQKRLLKFYNKQWCKTINYNIVAAMMISIDRYLLSFIMWSVWVVSCNTRWQLGLKQSQIPCFWHLSISQDRKIKQYLTLTSHFNVIENFMETSILEIKWMDLIRCTLNKVMIEKTIKGYVLIVMLNNLKYNQ